MKYKGSCLIQLHEPKAKFLPPVHLAIMQIRSHSPRRANESLVKSAHGFES